MHFIEGVAVERQRLSIQKDGTGNKLGCGWILMGKLGLGKSISLVAEKQLSEYGLTTDCTVTFKDLGMYDIMLVWFSYLYCA